MRYGIMSMRVDALVPAGVAPANLMSYLAGGSKGFDHATLVRDLAEAGFSVIELGADMSMFMPHTFSHATIERLAALKTELALAYTVHLPLWSVELSTPLAPVRKGSIQALVEAVKATRALNPEVYVLHATGSLAAEFCRYPLHEMAKSVILRQFQNNARESLQALLHETGLPPRKVAIETVEFPFDLTLELAEELDTSICIDTGHVLAGFSGPIDLFDALRRSLPRLAEIHLHDAPWQGSEMKIRYGEDHKPLGRGDLDVRRLLTRLVDAGFTGPIIFELSLAEALQSLELIDQISASL